MAEIPVQPKRGVPVWVWIVALIIIAIILWAIFGHHSSPPAATSLANPAHAAPLLARHALPSFINA